MTDETIISMADIEAARARIGPAVFTTPCARAEILSELLGYEVFLKLENLQMTGSFKERGSLNKILQLTQNRSVSEVKLGETELELLLETRGLEHVEEIRRVLHTQGFDLR